MTRTVHLQYHEVMSSSRWLSDDEQRAWRAYLQGSRLLAEEMEGQLRRDAGIPHTYYQILAVLSESEGQAMRMAELARLTRQSQSRLSHAITRLERAGWVERAGCTSDGRGTIAHLTEPGYLALGTAAPGHAATIAECVFDSLSPREVQVFTEIWDKVASATSARLETCPSPEALLSASDAEPLDEECGPCAQELSTTEPREAIAVSWGGSTPRS